MKTTTTILPAVCLTVSSFVFPALADQGNDRGPRCREVSGRATWTLVPAPNDPLGRVLGPTTGDLRAATTAHLTSLVPQANGSLKATSVEVWAIDDQDLLIFAGNATFTPIPGQPVGTFQDENTLTVSGGTGDYAGATGSLRVTGIGRNIVGPNAGPGKSYFAVLYRGTICRAR